MMKKKFYFVLCSPVRL